MPLRENIFIGQLLIDEKIITPQQLEAGLKEQKKTGEFICTTIIKLNFATEEQVFPVLSRQLGIPYVDIKKISVDAAVIKKVPAKFAYHYKLLPIKMERNSLDIAVTDPLDIHTLDDIRLLLDCEIKPMLAGERDILDGIKRYYGIGAEAIEKIMETKESLAISDLHLKAAQDIEEMVEDASIINFVNQLLLQAYKERATDIHIEPFEDELRIRTRIDGILYNQNIPANIKYFHPAIVSRIKIMANLNIAERRLPQDGRIIIKVAGEDLDLRVSVVPTSFGESVHIRLLSTNILLGLENLGLLKSDLKIFEELIKKPHGIIFVTGPTGSGKTTTLYACLSRISDATKKILTIEDPIEYQLKGITQIQVHPKIGLTFANGLRSMLRHDPDIMMVGEVRDYETAEITIRIALTGHLVFSTIHTNDAAGGVTRLLDIGIEPYLVVSSVISFIAQRLVRLICPKCKAPIKADRETLHMLGINAHEAHFQLFEGKGCEFCKFTGYRGRTAIYEILIVDDAIRELVLRRASVNEIKKAALSSGMRTLFQDGMEKVKMGLTTVSEVLRVAQSEETGE